MNHDSSKPSDILALVESRAVRLVRLRASEPRSLVRIPLGGSLTVAVAARVADALLDAQPAARLLVIPHDPAAAALATEFAVALDTRHPGDATAVLPDIETLLGLRASTSPNPFRPTGRRLLPRPSVLPHTVRLSATSRL